MLISVVEASENPTEAEYFKSIWQGGHRDHNESELPAAALIELISCIEIGIWYQFNKFCELFKNLSEESGVEIWTTVELLQLGVDGNWKATIETPQAFALKSMCLGIIAHIEKLHSGKNLWVRID